MRTKAGPKKVMRTGAGQQRPAQARTSKKRRTQGSQQDPAQTIAIQSKRAARKRKALEPVAQSSQPDKQAAEERSDGAGHRQVGNWPTMHDSLDIDFEHWDAAEIAQQWNMRARGETGDGSQHARQSALDTSYSDLTAEDMDPTGARPCAIQHQKQVQHSPTEEVARAAFYKRKGVAIPDDELARLGLSSSSNEAQEAAQLFWAGEELTDMGDGRFYPCRYVREEGDMAVMEWVQKEAQGILPAGDYEVTAILDARKQGRTTEYIVKWKGFELNPEQWLPHKMLVATKAMQAWAQKRAVHWQ